MNNKYFGSINIIDINTTSVSEIVAQILEQLESNLFDEDIATALLSGIIAKTQSFQHPLVSPKSFLKASELITQGARQQEIIKVLFKTKPLELLKLWGRALARLKDINTGSIAVLRTTDFVKAESDISYLPLVLKELVEHLNHKQYVFLLGELSSSNTKIFLGVRENYNWVENFKIFGQPKERKSLLFLPFLALEYDFEGSVEDVEKLVEKIV